MAVVLCICSFLLLLRLGFPGLEERGVGFGLLLDAVRAYPAFFRALFFDARQLKVNAQLAVGKGFWGAQFLDVIGLYNN